MRQKKWYLKVITLISPLVVLSGCLEFISIEQPSSVLPGETFTVFIEATKTDYNGGQPYFGVRLPVDWTVPGDAFPCTGVYNGTIIYDSNLALEQESISPSPEGYYWWVGVGDEIGEGSEGESAYAEIQIQTDNQIGRFSLDYMLGYSGPSPMGTVLNSQRSDNHLIEVVDEHSPRELQAVIEGDTVSLSWVAPFVSEGLIGYNVYRDGQIINTDLVVDTVYVDGNPVQELDSYTISSLYDNGDVHFIPYEIKVFVFSGGTGEPNDPYQIATAVQLASFSKADFPNLLDKCFVLVNDIDLDPNLPGGQVFNRAVIARDSSLEDYFQYNGFTGKFDGNGFRISNLTIVGQDYLGLFGAIHDGSQVRNLGIVDANVVGTGSHIGILADYNFGNVTNCYSTGSVSGDESIGGLVGSNSGSIDSSYSTVAVSGNSHEVGGLVGKNSGSITASCSYTNVKGENAVGGLVGRHLSGEIVDCYANGDVIGEWYVGGLVGSNGPGVRRGNAIRNCYAVTAVLRGHLNGGLLGCDWGGIVSNSFWDIETSGQTRGYSGIGKTMAEMQKADTFLEAGWDFVDETANGTEDIWWILEGQDYPRLWWELIPKN